MTSRLRLEFSFMFSNTHLDFPYTQSVLLLGKDSVPMDNSYRGVPVEPRGLASWLRVSGYDGHSLSSQESGSRFYSGSGPDIELTFTSLRSDIKLL